MTTALDAALAQLDAVLDETAVVDAAPEVVEQGAEPDTVKPTSIDDELAQLEAMMGIDVPGEEIDPVVDLPTLEEVATVIEMEESRSEAYSETVADGAADPDMPDAELTPDTSVAEKKAEKAKPKIKARAYGDAKPSAALIARLGSVEAASMHLKISESDETVDAKSLTETLKERLTKLDDLPKKVGEKAVNLIAHLGGGAKLSCYTEIAIKMLLDNGELTSKELFDRYIARPYSEGTSRSQCGQMMQLLPALGLADRTSRGSLALRKDSLIAKQLREVFSVAA